VRVTRRDFIRGGVAAFTVSFGAPAFISDLARAQGASRRNLVVLYLNGGNDALSTLAPYTDPFYYSRRPTIAIPAGIISAVKRNSVFDHLSMGVVLLGQSVPTFWLGMLMILVFAVVLHALPVSGRGSFAQLVLPSVTLAMWLLALVARLTRSGMLEVLSQDYIRTARAKGLAEVVVTARHAVRNALVPIVTVVGLQVGGLLGGAVMTEAVFAWPGVGTLVLESILKRDYPLVLAALIMVAAAFVLINLMVDLLCGYLDPRVRTGWRG